MAGVWGASGELFARSVAPGWPATEKKKAIARRGQMRAMGNKTRDLGFERAGLPMLARYGICPEEMPRDLLVTGTILARIERAQRKQNATALLRGQGRGRLFAA